MKKLLTVLLFLLFISSAFAQSVISVDKLERKDIAQASKEVGFSVLLEGVVNSPDLTVYALVYQPHLKMWRLFPATVDEKPEGANYRWRALCHLGELDGKGVGDQYQVKILAFDSNTVKSNGLPKKLSSNVLNSNSIVLKRVK